MTLEVENAFFAAKFLFLVKSKVVVNGFVTKSGKQISKVKRW